MSGMVQEPFESVAELVERSAKRLFTSKSREDIHKRGEIPPKKLSNAIDSYAQGLDADRVLLLQDRTTFGSAKEGSLFTDATLYSKAARAEPQVIPYRGIRSVALRQDENDDVKSDRLILVYGDGAVREIEAQDYFSLPNLESFFLAIMEANDRGLTKEVDGFVIVQDMSAETRLAYIGTLAWLTYRDDEAIDTREMAELQVLITQLEFDAPLRAKARVLICTPEELDAPSLVEQLTTTAPSGSESALGVALMRDAVRVHRATSDGAAKDNPGVVELAELLDINAEQLEFIEEACVVDEQVLSGELSDDELARQAKELAAKAAAVGVPMAAVYLSGSVVGLSAAGITSGLAALGLGGVLGLSSMVTGVGVVILVGVGAYQGVRWLSGSGERSKASRREFMLKEVLLNHQKAISNLGEDIAWFAGEIAELTRGAEIRRAQLQALARKVELLAGTITSLKERERGFEGDLATELALRVDA